MEPAVRIFDRLLEVTVLLQKDLERSFEQNGLTLARTHLLWVLNRLGSTTQKSLADALEVSARNVTGLVDALEATGFVTRAAHPSDRRATLVSLTELGARTMREMEQDRLRLSEELIEGIDQERVKQIADGLDSITGRLRALVDADEKERS